MADTDAFSTSHHPKAGVSRSMRTHLSGQTARALWLTGLSGAGKSTLAMAIETELHHLGYHTYLLDGDDIRSGLNSDLGFSDADRHENIRRAAEVTRLMLDAGLIVICAFISPLAAERRMVRTVIGAEDFLEIHVSTPLHVCEMRDTKGLYQKARQGRITNLAGLDCAYEAPVAPFATFDGSGAAEVEQAARDLAHAAFPIGRLKHLPRAPSPVSG